jgi:hypothetical protein
MGNVDSIIFTKSFIMALEEDNFFDEKENPFMDVELLYNEILKHSTNNMLECDNPEITIEQFDESIKAVRVILITETFNDLIDDGLIEPTGVDMVGELLYSINEDIKESFEKKIKKNRPKT